jgi:hypothetical protein
MEKGKKPKKTNKKRPRDGKGKYFQDSPSDGQFSDGGSFADSNAV